MNSFSPFGIPGFDPSKMDPKLLMELSQLIQRLPAEQLNRMQTLMHNTMAGYDTKKEKEAFERELPADFRAKMVQILGANAASLGASFSSSASSTPYGTKNDIEIESLPTPAVPTESSSEMDLREARLTLLRAVASGSIPPEDAERLLFGVSG